MYFPLFVKNPSGTVQKLLYEVSEDFHRQSAIWQLTARRIFEELLKGDLSIFKIVPEKVPQRAYGYPSYAGRGYGYRYDAGSFITILCGALSIYLHKESLNLATFVLTNMLGHEKSLIEEYVSTSWLQDLVALVKKHPNDQFKDVVENFMKEVMRIIARDLTQSCPSPPTDWKRKPRDTHCKCAQCLDLRRLMVSPTEEIGRFRYNGDIRKHLQKSVPSVGYSVRKDKSGPSPYTLVVQKNHQAYFNERDQ